MDDARNRQIYATVNASVFIFQQIEIRIVQLENLMLGYFSQYKNELSPRQVKFDVGYLYGNQIVGLAWDIIDWLDRLRKILGTLTGVRTRELWFKDLKNALESVKPMCNFMQHFDRSISSFYENSYPLMGSVSACFPIGSSWTIILIASNPIRSHYHQDKATGIGTVHVPEVIQGEIDHIIFSIEERFLNLTDLKRSILAAKGQYQAYLKKRYDYQWP